MTLLMTTLVPSEYHQQFQHFFQLQLVVNVMNVGLGGVDVSPCGHTYFSVGGYIYILKTAVTRVQSGKSGARGCSLRLKPQTSATESRYPASIPMPLLTMEHLAYVI